MISDDCISAIQKCHEHSINYKFKKGKQFSIIKNNPFEGNILILKNEEIQIPFYDYIASLNGFEKLNPLYKKYWDEIVLASDQSITNILAIRKKWIEYLTESLIQTYFQQLNTSSYILLNKDYFNSKQLQQHYSLIENLYCGFYPKAKKNYKSGILSLDEYHEDEREHFKDIIESVLNDLIKVWDLYFKIQVTNVIEVSTLYRTKPTTVLSKVTKWEEIITDDQDSLKSKLIEGSGHKQNAEIIRKKFKELKNKNLQSTQEEIIGLLQNWYEAELGVSIGEGTIRYHLGKKR